MSNSKFSSRAANAIALWRMEILSASVVFLCAALTLKGLWQTNVLASKKIAALQERLLFVKKNLQVPGGLMAAPRHRQKADAGQTIAGIRQAAQISGLSVNHLSIKSEDVSKEKNVSALPLEFSATTPQNALLPFIDRLKNLNFLCRVVFLYVKPDPVNDANLSISLKLERLNLLAPIPKETLNKSAGDFKAGHSQTAAITTRGTNIFKNIVSPEHRAVQTAALDPNAPNIKDLSLVGIIDNGQPKVLITNNKDSKTYHLAKGDATGGFVVADILHQEVVLEKDQIRYSLTL